jgi:large subunit ribosomal protein L6
MSRTGKKPGDDPLGRDRVRRGRCRLDEGAEGHPLDPDGRRGHLHAGRRQADVAPANETKRARAFWGMQRTLVQNLVTGVTEGYTKVLEITGVGYRANARARC